MTPLHAPPSEGAGPARPPASTDRPAILAVNAGSSSLKLGVYDATTDDLRLLARVHVTGVGVDARWRSVDADGVDVELAVEPTATHAAVLRTSLGWIRQRFARLELVAAGHRVVHGGAGYLAPTRVTSEVLSALRQFNDLAPLHEPHNIRGIEAVAEVAPSLPQVACFDTSFHSTVAGPAAVFALPRYLTESGVRRYGFHGLSYDYIASVLPRYLGATAEGRIVVAHLGHGASMCALSGRHSVATTMSMTPLDGLPMGTRSGALDPGVTLYLQQSRGLSVEEVSHLLYDESGLLGMSGISAYMEDLLASDDPRAREAVDYYVYWAARTVASLAGALGGLDAIVFTAGVGEHSAPVRARILEACAWLGVELDAGANDAHAARITSDRSRVSAWVIPTDEEIIVARATAALLRPAA